MNFHEDSLIRRALVGRKLLLVGGDPCPNRIQRLETSLELAEAIHCSTRKSDASARSFKSKLRTPRLALVICARGMTRTQHGADLHDLCRKLGLPLLDFNHIPHPNALVAAVARARLTHPLLERCSQFPPCIAELIGGAI